MTGVKLEYITDDKLTLLLENKMRSGPSSLLANSHVKRGEKKYSIGILYIYVTGVCHILYQLEIFRKFNLELEIMKEIFQKKIQELQIKIKADTY